MEVKDIIIQSIRIVNLLEESYRHVLARKDDYNREHDLDGFYTVDPPFGLAQIEIIIDETYNMIVQWLLDGMEDYELSNLVNNESLMSFWNFYFRSYKRNYSDKEDVIKYLHGDMLEKIKFKIIYDDDVKTRVDMYDKSHAQTEEPDEVKEDK